MKKKLGFILVLVFACAVFLPAQADDSAAEQPEGRNASGLVRFNALGTLLSLVVGFPSAEFSVVPFINDTVGIPVTVNLVSYYGYLGVGLFTGINITPSPKIQNDGLFISIEAGGLLAGGYLIFAGVFDIGYQYISKKGFVFTPAGGFAYNDLTGFSLDLMLDIGFTF